MIDLDWRDFGQLWKLLNSGFRQYRKINYGVGDGPILKFPYSSLAIFKKL